MGYCCMAQVHGLLLCGASAWAIAVWCRCMGYWNCCMEGSASKTQIDTSCLFARSQGSIARGPHCVRKCMAIGVVAWRWRCQKHHKNSSCHFARSQGSIAQGPHCVRKCMAIGVAAWSWRFQKHHVNSSCHFARSQGSIARGPRCVRKWLGHNGWITSMDAGRHFVVTGTC